MSSLLPPRQVRWWVRSIGTSARGALAPGLSVVSGGAQTAHAFAGKSKVHFDFPEVIAHDCSINRVGHSAVGFETVVARSEVALHANSDEHEGIFNELEVLESDCSKNREALGSEFETAGGRAEKAAHATAGELVIVHAH